MKLKVAAFINGSPKPESVIEFEKPEVPDGWKVVGGNLTRWIVLPDKTRLEITWRTNPHKFKAARP